MNDAERGKLAIIGPPLDDPHARHSEGEHLDSLEKRFVNFAA
jgi:hypothetical protein